MTMSDIRTNIVLVGMPGSGKSTVGVILAKMLSWDFIDTDILIQLSHGRTLQDIVDKDGYFALRKIEEEILLQLRCNHHVIATGGSAAYSDAAMNHLKTYGHIVFLDVDLHTLEQRIHNFDTRGLAKRKDQTLADLFQERCELYKKFAEVTIECGSWHQEKIVTQLLNKMEKENKYHENITG